MQRDARDNGRASDTDGLDFFFLFHVDVREVDRDTLEPILFLLQSSDIEVQRAASAALGNLAVNGPFFPFFLGRCRRVDDGC